MYICICVYMYVCIYICICMYICIHVYVYIHIYTRHIYIYVCIYIYIYIYIHIYIYIYLSLSLSLYIYIYIYIYISCSVRPGLRPDDDARGERPRVRLRSPGGPRCQSYTSRGLRRQGKGSSVRSSCVSKLGPVVVGPYLCTSDAAVRRGGGLQRRVCWLPREPCLRRPLP